MIKEIIKSDQFNKWSDFYEKLYYPIFKKTSKDTYSKNSYISTKYFKRVINRKIQTLRQTRLQMRSNCWTWPKVLPINFIPQKKTGTRLCSPANTRTSKRIPGKSQKNTGSARRNLQYKQRIIKKKRKILIIAYELRLQKYDWRFSCQYDSNLSSI
jgi:hypothetical protein